MSPYKGPRNLQTSEPTKTSFRVTWDPAPGEVKGYKVTFHPAEDDIDLRELLVGPFDNTVVLEELRCVSNFSIWRFSTNLKCYTYFYTIFLYVVIRFFVLWFTELELNTQ